MAEIKSATWALRRGQRLARASRLDASLAAFETAGDAPDPRVLIQHALTLARAGRLDAALEKAAAAAAASHGDPVPALFNAYLLLRAGRSEAARTELARARELAPANPIGPTLAAALELFGDAPADACRALLDGPLTDNLEILGWVLALVERKVFEAAGTDSGAIPPEPAGKPDAPPAAVTGLSAGSCAKRGEKLLESGKPNAAVAHLAKAVELDPENPAHRVMHGAALFEVGRFAEAESELARAPADGPLAGVAKFYGAANGYRLGRYQTTLDLIESLPLVGDAFFFAEWCDYLRGMALVALGRIDEAATQLAAFLDVEPDLLSRRLTKAIEILTE